MGSEELEKLLEQASHKVRVPQPNDKVYKDECVYSFDTPASDTGLFICLKTFYGLGKDNVERHYKRTDSNAYLHIKTIKHKLDKPMDAEGPEKKVTRLAIGVEGGFDSMADKNEYTVEEFKSLVLMPGFHFIDLPLDAKYTQITSSINGVLAAESGSKLAEMEQMASAWDGEVRQISKHSEILVQLNTKKGIPLEGWTCENERCDKTDNLWLNLTDGSIFCGRKNFDGSGGNNHALDHYAATRFPLAVKLGTITPDGRADVFSYDEDDLVIDSNLVTHLAHFGINIAQMEKTEKSIAEMEIELNSKTIGESLAVTESGKNLEPKCGPGLTGMVNLGNSCYLNSVMQVIFSIPNFWRRFTENALRYFESSNDPVNDFNVQMSKLCDGLTSGKYAIKSDISEMNTDSQVGINAAMFKTLIGRGHPEFATKKQQDAQEFFLHLINTLQRYSVHEKNPADCFKFKVEDKIVCDASGHVKYSYRTEYAVPFAVPLEAATNTDEVLAYEKKLADAKANKDTLPEVVRYKVPFESCLQAFLAKETLEKFYSTSVDEVVTASKFTRLSTFPDYLVVQLKKFAVSSDLMPKKLDVSVDMPMMLDISALRGRGVQPNEVELPSKDPKKSAPKIDESVVAQLLEMGFQPNACRRAVISSGNSGAEMAMNWIMQHMDDPDLNEPINMELGSGGGAQATFVPDPEAVSNIVGMGFTPAQATRALKNTNNSVERAIEWIFSHPDEIDCPDDDVQMLTEKKKPKDELPDGPGVYELTAFISHIGPSSMVGHYVCHILKDGVWTIFNDNRVAKSESLPKDLGYLYFYRRIQSN